MTKKTFYRKVNIERIERPLRDDITIMKLTYLDKQKSEKYLVIFKKTWGKQNLLKVGEVFIWKCKFFSLS
jgi:hypothetical protein